LFTHHDYRVNVVTYSETKKSGEKNNFSWVTRLNVSPENIDKIMKAGRARWKVENETFNTLKNQGYHFEHNFGHGYNNLCSVMTMVMMLAFLIDQVQQLCCTVYKKARKHVGSLSALFEEVRVLIKFGVWKSWLSLYDFIGDPKKRGDPGEQGWISP
jgi:hypothetical protein